MWKHTILLIHVAGINHRNIDRHGASWGNLPCIGMKLRGPFYHPCWRSEKENISTASILLRVYMGEDSSSFKRLRCFEHIEQSTCQKNFHLWGLKEARGCESFSSIFYSCESVPIIQVWSKLSKQVLWHYSLRNFGGNKVKMQGKCVLLIKIFLWFRITFFLIFNLDAGRKIKQ